MKFKLNHTNTTKDKSKKSLYSFKLSSDNDIISQVNSFVTDNEFIISLSEKSSNQSILFRNNKYSMWIGVDVTKNQSFQFMNSSYDGELVMNFVQKNMDNTYERTLICIVPIVVVDDENPSILSEIIKDTQNTRNEEQIINLYEPTNLISLIPNTSYYVLEMNDNPNVDIVVLDIASGGSIPISNEAHEKLLRLDKGKPDELLGDVDMKTITTLFIEQPKKENVYKWLDRRSYSEKDKSSTYKNIIISGVLTFSLIIAILYILVKNK